MFHASSSPRWWRPSSGRPATVSAWSIPGRRRSPYAAVKATLAFVWLCPKGYSVPVARHWRVNWLRS